MGSRTRAEIPPEFNRVRDVARRTVAPVKPADENTAAKEDFLFTAKRAVRYDELPPPYLIYFLLVELLGFRDLGRFGPQCLRRKIWKCSPFVSPGRWTTDVQSPAMLSTRPTPARRGGRRG